MLKIGICEDDPAIRNIVKRALALEGYEPVLAFNGAEASRLFAQQPLDVIVMDIGLPDADGRDVVQALKAGGQHAPVLFLSALDALDDRLAGFSAGAEDYVTKPFEIMELLARIQVLGRRARTAPSRPIETLELDPIAYGVRSATASVALTPTEFRVLAIILSRPGEVVRRSSVIAAGWPDGLYVAENTVDSHLRRIRIKLESINSPISIQTVRGVGYRIM